MLVISFLGEILLDKQKLLIKFKKILDHFKSNTSHQLLLM